MATVNDIKHNDFHWTPANLSLAIAVGVAVTLGFWLFTGLLISFFTL